MTDRPKNDARLSLRLPSDSKRVIEAAAAEFGQSASEFAVSTLVRAAHNVIDQPSTTQLSARDREIFVAMLDDVEAKPNKSLAAAAKRYKRNAPIATEGESDIARLFREGKPIDDALNAAVREVVLQHKQLGMPLVVWRDGKVVWIPPEEIPPIEVSD